MDEEYMWKSFFEKVQEMKMNPPTEHEQKLQDVDESFFEKFGSLLRQKSQLEEMNLESSPFHTNENNYKEKFENGYDPKDQESSIDFCSIKEQGQGQAEVKECITESFEGNYDATRNGKILKELIGMNLEDLYEEILFEIDNNIGFETNNISKEALIEFVQEVFKIPNSKHEEILEIAKQKEPPNVRLNVEIIKAENLLPKDSNGLSDPFITLYLESNASHRYNSSVKSKTLNPLWEEHFSLPIIDSAAKEVLVIEVWDFDAAETIKEKVNKILEVKGVKGLRKLVKEIAVTASSGKHDNELIGRAAIPLKSVSVSGLTAWYNLEKGNRTRSRGSILINLTLSAEKNKNVAVQEHRHLLNLLLMNELESSQVVNYWWSGKFCTYAEAIRSQHAAQSGLSYFECSLCQWHSYTTIHETHKLSFSLFNSLLNAIVPMLKNYQSDNEELKIFWEGSIRLFPSLFAVFRRLRLKNTSDKHIINTLSEVLDIFAKLKSIVLFPGLILFPKNVYGWISRGHDEESNIEEVILDAINIGAKEWLEHLAEGNKEYKNFESDETKLQYLIKLIQMVRSDLLRAMEYFDKVFYQKIRMPYSSVLFKFYDEKLSEISKSIIEDVCANLKRLDVPDDQFDYLPNIENLNMGTTLFELYIVLKRYLTLGNSLCANEKLEMENFYCWFERGVTHWLDISIIKALNRVQKAIDLDQLKAVDETVKYSSSAVDTLAIFYQIKIFWHQLDWPEIEGSYIFIAKIINDICRCCIFYAQKMSIRVEDLKNQEGEFFIVSPEWCLAINNIDYIRQSLPSFIKELGYDEIIRKLGEYRTKLEAERCSATIDTVLENALDIEKNQIVELIELVVHKMAFPIRRFLAEGAEVLHEDSNSMEKLMTYLENSLGTLYNTLNESNFGRILDAIWNQLSIIMYDLIQSNLAKRRPPAFFQNLRQTLHTMISCFKTGSIITSDVEVLCEIERILDLHAFETSDLIHQYYLERLGFQKQYLESPYGQLTIKAHFTDNGLVLNILNARNLVPMDTNGSCDPFVKAYFLPTNRFNGLPVIKTGVQHKTRFPLYDEEFFMKLSWDQRSNQNSLILFTIKDKDLFGMTNQYIAECYITFADLLGFENEQIHMELSRPEYADSDTLRALELRQGDKQARDFIKKLKNKSYS